MRVLHKVVAIITLIVFHQNRRKGGNVVFMMAGIVNTCVQAAPIILTIRAKKRKSTRTFDDLYYILETKFQKIVDSAIIR